MVRWMRRLLSLMLVVMTIAALASPMAVSEDWREKLRNAFELSDEDAYSSEKPSYEEEPSSTQPITDAQELVNYLDVYGELPWNFLTKAEAKKLGWDSRFNYVGEVAPDMSIGGDRFGNYEGSLPDRKGRKWYECDVGYTGKKRNAKRLLYSSDGLYYYTDDHYETFKQMFPEGKR